MKSDSSNMLWRVLAAAGAVFVIIMAVLTIQSFQRLFNKAPPPADNIPVPAADIATVSEEEQRHFALSPPSPPKPAAAPVFAPPFATTAPAPMANAPPAKPPEKSRAEIIANMRQWARDHGGTNRGIYERKMRPVNK